MVHKELTSFQNFTYEACCVIPVVEYLLCYCYKNLLKLGSESTMVTDGICSSEKVHVVQTNNFKILTLESVGSPQNLEDLKAILWNLLYIFFALHPQML